MKITTKVPYKPGINIGKTNRETCNMLEQAMRLRAYELEDRARKRQGKSEIIGLVTVSLLLALGLLGMLIF